MIDNRETARQYKHEFGMSLIPLVPRSKEPEQGFPLGRYLDGAKQADDVELSCWFGSDSQRNVAVVLGLPSDSLAPRDFDTPDGYRNWAERFPGLASRFPTVKTRRGHHIYFRCDPRDVADASPTGSRIIRDSSGELKPTGYTVLPRAFTEPERRTGGKMRP